MDDATKMTLSGMAASFFSSLLPEKRQEGQPEVTKFIRWCGRDRDVSEITNQEVEQYATGLSNSPAANKGYEHVRAFLAYAHKQRATKTNLASSFRLKKTSASAARSTRLQQDVTQLTEEGHRRLSEELKELKGSRGQIAEELRRAAADKDFRENAPLEVAREHQGQVESKIRELEATLGSAVVLKKGMRGEKTTQVSIGSSVGLKDLTSGENLTYILVASHEANLAEGKLSISSPVGKALLGRAKGEEVEVKVPAGTFRYFIEGIGT